MNANDPNVAALEVVAHRLGDKLWEQLVFIGGAVAGLLITDPASPAIRPTADVDLIAGVASLANYHAIERALTQQGFTHDVAHGAPICRWRIGAVAVDVMPTLESILGFTNRWYQLALHTAELVDLPSGLRIRLIPARVLTPHSSRTLVKSVYPSGADFSPFAANVILICASICNETSH